MVKPGLTSAMAFHMEHLRGASGKMMYRKIFYMPAQKQGFIYLMTEVKTGSPTS